MKCLKLLTILIIISSFASCGSDDSCTKIEKIQQYYQVNNQPYPYNVYSEVECSFIPPYEAVLIDPVILPNTSYEVINFQYSPSSPGSNSILSFELKINNNEDYAVDGFAVVYFVVDGIERNIVIDESTTVTACPLLSANGHCTVQFYEENVFNASSVSISEVVYYVVSE